MKKIFTSFLALVAYVASFAQVCTPDQSFTEPGLFPASDEVCCYVRNEPVNQTITFKNFTTVAGLTINSLTVTDIVNLPTGLSYAFNTTPPTYSSGAYGCLQVTGSPTGAAGQYKLKIYVTLNVLGLGNISGEADSLASAFGLSFKYLVRLRDAGQECQLLDTNQTNANAFIAYPLSGVSADPACPISVKENEAVSSLTVLPNPVNDMAIVSFEAEKSGNMTYSVTNMIGNTILSENLEVNSGKNTFTINRNNLPAGIYFLNITDKKNTVSRKFVISE